MAKSKKARAPRSRNERRQATPPMILPTEPPSQQQSGVARVNKEIATLIARKDPVLHKVSKKSKVLSKAKKERLEAKMEKAAAKADQLVEKTVKAHQRGKKIKKRRADWDAINEKPVQTVNADGEEEGMKLDE